MSLSSNGIEWSEKSHYAQEMKKWDTPKSQGGYKCDGFEPYPKMLYKAQLHPISHVFSVMTDRDVLSPDGSVVVLSKESFDARCQMIVNDEREHEKAKAQGWRDTPKEAEEYQSGVENEKAVAAAVRNYEDRNMSEKAKAEALEIEQHSGSEHLGEIPAKPLPPKAAAKRGWSEARRAAHEAKKSKQAEA